MKKEHHVGDQRQSPTSLSRSFIKKLAVKYDGKLLIRSELQINDSMLHSFLTKSVITNIPSITKRWNTFTCNRCGNHKQSLFGKMPCVTCHKETVYCRKCIEMGRVMQCHDLYYWSGSRSSRPKLTTPCTWRGTLNSYQQHAAVEIVEHIKSGKDILVWSVTGSGKTEMVFPGISEALQLGKRVCIATPRADVVRELLPRCQAAFKDVPIHALYGGSKDKNGTAQFVIATTHQLIRYKRAFDVIIIDEVDAFPYHADQSLPYVTKRARRKNGTTIYLTATPRTKQKWQMKLNHLNHVFVPARFHGHPLPIPKFLFSLSLSKQIKHYKTPPGFKRWLKNRQNPERQLLIFVPTIKLATKLTPHLITLLQNESIIPNANAVTSVHSKDEDREEKVNLFRKKKLTVLITTTILERGVTFPSVDVAVLHAGHDVFDEAALIQIAGRAGRGVDDPTGDVIFIHDGKTNAMVNARETLIEMNERALKQAKRKVTK